jgi:hypothetical protein
MKRMEALYQVAVKRLFLICLNNGIACFLRFTLQAFDFKSALSASERRAVFHEAERCRGNIGIVADYILKKKLTIAPFWNGKTSFE